MDASLTGSSTMDGKGTATEDDSSSASSSDSSSKSSSSSSTSVDLQRSDSFASAGSVSVQSAPEVEIISEAENDADRLNPYPRNSEETVADEAYVCRELPIVAQCRGTIKKTWPEMKTEFGKHIGVTV